MRPSPSACWSSRVGPDPMRASCSDGRVYMAAFTVGLRSVEHLRLPARSVTVRS